MTTGDPYRRAAKARNEALKRLANACERLALAGLSARDVGEALTAQVRTDEKRKRRIRGEFLMKCPHCNDGTYQLSGAPQKCERCDGSVLPRDRATKGRGGA